jgi:ABC-type Mn2+/Zn2+ transport system ATPase subunit
VSRNLTASYGRHVVLSRINLSLTGGGLTAIVGPAGAGKSTLLRCAVGLLPPRAGEIEVLGEAPGRARRQVAYLPQHLLLDWRLPLSVLDVVLMGRYSALGPFRRVGRDDREQARARLAEVGLADLADWSVGELSTEQRCRVLLARALVQRPSLLLLDEMLTGLDSRSEREILSLLEALAAAGPTVLLATRELAALAGRFNEVVLLNGSVIGYGRPADVLTRANLEATFGAEPINLRVGAEYFAVDA